MSEVPPIGYLAIFAGAAILSLVLVPLALRLALRLEVLDRPGGYKEQPAPVPYLGGMAIVVAFSAAVLAAALIRPPVSGLPQLVVILVLAVLISLVGLLDDLRGLGVWPRLVVVVLAGAVLWRAGVAVDLFPHWSLDLAVTVLWVAGITHALNLLDNMDGLSAGVAAIAAAFLGLIAALNGQFLVASLAAALAGCALGFLRHNYHPARIYMGDAGSLFLGFMLAVLGIELTIPPSPIIASFVPILVLGVAIFDTALVTLGRLVHGRSPFQGGRDHVSHRLVRLGVPVRIAVGLIYAGAVGLGWLGVVMARLVDAVTAYLLLGFAVTTFIALGAALGRVPVYDTDPPRSSRDTWSDTQPEGR